ncbi:MAG TPA: ROK family protein [Candidatus Eremiobacteraceae bacterium]|nr:ROK family protein [Candidatus Eremiobacteraceae bacterium]
MGSEIHNELIVGVDIGGTKVAAGLVDHSGTIVAQTRTAMVATDAARGLAAVAVAIEELRSRSGEDFQPHAIGICAPGPLNPRTGVVINPPNLPGWHNFPLAEEIRKLYPAAQVKIDNDANAAALAEAKWGAGRSYRNVFYATIGTGIGTGFVIDGKVYHGRTGLATEGGHVGVDLHGPQCACGKRGCIETLAAGPAIARRARAKLALAAKAASGDGTKSALLEMAGGKPDAVTSEMVAKCYASGDALAKEVMHETLDLLAYWLGNVIDLLEPDVIVIGGGVSSMLAPFLEEIRARWVGACLSPYPHETPLVLAHYKEDAGIAGAAALCDTN